jgi:hypothetical protein
MGWWIITTLFGQQTPTPTSPSDPMSWINAIGLASLLIVYVADKIISHFKSRGIDLQDIATKINELHTWYDNTTDAGIAKKVSDLHDWHNHDDPEQPGVKIWWNQKYLADIIQELAKIQRSQAELLREMHREQQTTTQILTEQVKLLTGIVKTQDEMMREIKDLHKKVDE